MPMDSAGGNAVLTALGFPIRESADHWLFSASPRLIAAVHALHRLLVPRHPPCALPILTVIIAAGITNDGRDGDTRSHPSCEECFVGMIVQFSRSASRRTPGLGVRSLKTQQHAPARASSSGARSGRH